MCKSSVLKRFEIRSLAQVFNTEITFGTKKIGSALWYGSDWISIFSWHLMKGMEGIYLIKSIYQHRFFCKVQHIRLYLSVWNSTWVLLQTGTKVTAAKIFRHNEVATQYCKNLLIIYLLEIHWKHKLFLGKLSIC
jgi:hypothetical protein